MGEFAPGKASPSGPQAPHTSFTSLSQKVPPTPNTTRRSLYNSFLCRTTKCSGKIAGLWTNAFVSTSGATLHPGFPLKLDQGQTDFPQISTLRKTASLPPRASRGARSHSWPLQWCTAPHVARFVFFPPVVSLLKSHHDHLCVCLFGLGDSLGSQRKATCPVFWTLTNTYSHHHPVWTVLVVDPTCHLPVGGVHKPCLILQLHKGERALRLARR